MSFYFLTLLTPVLVDPLALKYTYILQLYFILLYLTFYEVNNFSVKYFMFALATNS